MKPLAETAKTDAEVEQIVAQASLYRASAPPQFVVAGLLLAAGYVGGFWWHVNEGCRFLREASKRDGRGVSVSGEEAS
jgi:hypothetical protein